jgi:tetratricopeptide (TPR) repeat protein
VNINPRIPVVLSELTMRLLAKSKHDRPMNAEEVIARLEAFAEQREPEESKWSSIQMAPSLEEIPDTLPHEMQRTPPSLRSSTRTAPRPHTPYPTEPLRQPNRSSGASKQLLIGAILTLLIIGLSISLYFLLNQKPKNETDPNAERLAQMQKELQEQKRRQEEEQNRRDDDERQRKERDAATEEELKRQSEALAKAKEQIERETRQRKEAEEALRKQRDQLKNDADALLNLEKQRQAKITTWLEEGKRAFEQREYDQAIDKFTQVIVEDSQNGEAFAYRAWAYNRSTRSVEARFDADDAVKFSPKSPFAYTIRAIVRDARADAALGIEDCNKALELDPKYALAYSRRGWLKAILKDKEPARQDANKGIELDPKSKWGYYFRAWVRNELADYDDAITDCQKVLALDPKSAEAYDELGFAYDRLREYRKAVEAYTKLIELRPKSSEAYRDRGSTYSQLGENDAAEEDFDKAIELDPKNARAYNSRGVFYEKQKFYTLALEDYTKAIEIDPNFEDAYLNRADVYEARDEEGDPARARADRQKAEEIRKK